MPPSFLCPQHRQWLGQRLAATERHLHTARETAEYHLCRGHFEQALPALGCAWETADILIRQWRQQQPSDLLMYTSCAIALADTLAKLGGVKDCLAVLKSSRTCLDHCSAARNTYSCFNECADALDSGIRWYASRADYATDARCVH